MTHGELFVMTTGQLSMPMCSVNRLDTLGQVYHNFADHAIQAMCFHRSFNCAMSLLVQMLLHTIEHSLVRVQHR